MLFLRQNNMGHFSSLSAVCTGGRGELRGTVNLDILEMWLIPQLQDDTADFILQQDGL